MLKKIFFFFTVIAIFNSNQVLAFDHPDGCPVGRAEKIVCAMVMCGFGASVGEYPSECNQVKLDFVAYMATLGFWDKPARCFNRDQDCNKDGRAKKAPASPEMCAESGVTQSQCERGVAINNADCDEMTGAAHQECIIKLARDTHSCNELPAAEAFECLNLEENDKVLDSGVYGDLHGKIAIRFGGELVALDDAVPTYLNMVKVNDSRMDSLGRALVLAGVFGPADCPMFGGALKAHCDAGLPLACWGLSGNYRDKDTELGQCVSKEFGS